MSNQDCDIGLIGLGTMGRPSLAAHQINYLIRVWFKKKFKTKLRPGVIPNLIFPRHRG